MNCPVCSHDAISLPRFLLVIYPKKLPCSHCGDELTWSAKWKNVFHWSIAICGISAVGLSVLFNATGISLVIYIAVIVVASLVFNSLFWRISTYENNL